ncbi:hypothetical protein [Actinocatenispora comari]|uniref:Uncharacterized protein n=1 Tax=Actinocatenispora comari TaxID=2807577 RepID=A0A8J4ADQ1_9ACTN|nr:hypothetical protein [Actinocatenispora comari]GIL29158.1 hypothetical protein NUM_44120 [Actinocatenispora comari]
MPRTTSPADKRRDRQLAAEQGVPYHQALNQVRGVAASRDGRAIFNSDRDVAPAIFDADRGIDGCRAWDDIVTGLDAAEQHLQDSDPYARAAAAADRGRLFAQMGARTTDKVYAHVCQLAALYEEQEGARIRCRHRIPTVFPRTQAAAVGLSTCDWCGRPWQADPTGACEHCPRLVFGPSPASREEAARYSPGQPVTADDIASWSEPVDGD